MLKALLRRPSFLAAMLPAPALILALSLILPGATQAAIIVDLVQTSFTARTNGFGDGGPLSFSAQLVVDEDAFARGASPTIFNQPAVRPFSSRLDGLLNFEVTLLNPNGSLVAQTSLDDFLRPFPPFASFGFEKNLSLGLSPAAILGTIRFNDQASDFQLTLAGDGTFRGAVNTDRGGTCGVTGNCTFGGVVLVSVPEPSGLAAIALGAFVLAAARRQGSGGQGRPDAPARIPT